MSRWLGVVVIVLAAGCAWTYSWTYTSIGRLDYQAALLAKIAKHLAERPKVITDAYRSKQNARIKAFADDADYLKAAKIQDIDLSAPWGVVPVRIYYPAGAGPFPMLLHLHGGGFWMGNGYIFDGRLQHLAMRLNAVLVSIDYRLAPEHVYPAALDDAYFALEYLVEHSQKLGIDASNIAVFGASAGGNLAAALALRSRDSSGPPLTALVLEVPATDLSGEQHWQSFVDADDNYILKVSELDATFSRYVPDKARQQDPYVSPLLAVSQAGLPPTFLAVAQFDPLRDQGIAYAAALQRDGVPVTLERVEGVLHGFAGSRKKYWALLVQEESFLQGMFNRSDVQTRE